MQLGYLKDSIAVIFFIIALIKLYYLTSKNVSNFKNEISIYVFLAFLLDGKYTLHPEMHCKDFALNDIKKYLSRFGRKKLKHITIVIWKQNREGILKSINCCGWCKKSILKCGLNNNQIITPIVEDGIWNGEFKSSIVECSKRPVLLMKNKL